MPASAKAATSSDGRPASRCWLWGPSSPDRPSIIPLLQEVQARHGYLPREEVVKAAATCGMSVTQAYAVATFYNFFRLRPPGRHTIRICRGTACHVRGSAALLDHVEQLLGVGDGETTEDGDFSVETVACLGCCSRAPVVVVDETVHGRVGRQELTRLIRRIRSGAAVRRGEHHEHDDR